MAQTASMKAKALAVLGTGSDVGKSVIAAALCRLFFRVGIRVAPFKAQNMSNNSCVTKDGKEIGRAQGLQAQACGLDPQADMNPILLKPESDCRAQIVVQGKVWGRSDAQNYFTHKAELADYVKESYERLASVFELIVIEGAGSAAELNLRDRDLANWAMVEAADARVILVADIDRGGVFAQVIGTLDLINPEERVRVIGVVINKFRGDRRLFEDGVRLIESRTGVPVLGVVPMLRGFAIDEEDSLAVNRTDQTRFNSSHVNVAVVLLPRMSNFTDFKHLASERDVRLRFVARSEDLLGADVVIIPGSKNTLEDLAALCAAGFTEAVRRHVEAGGELIGICGGFQMLGRRVSDPDGVESGGASDGLGYLDVVTVLMPAKTTDLVEAEALHAEDKLKSIVRGYYIHMGATHRGQDRPCFRVVRLCGVENPNDLSTAVVLDGAVNRNGLVWGTYIHGVFDQPEFRRDWLNRIRRRKGLEVLSRTVSELVSRELDDELDRWADHVGGCLDLKPILRAMGAERPMPSSPV